ncbi:MAG: tRNA (guanine-N(1)-)-methyltransferase [Candidatus Moranbacteria bacterium GW2011_GWF2_36_839]|nr:MAG: tRNA (guanine-N(1)-)-methyltransferase [Candidatus Moranbacteria bacterium GW2011_GWF1_36_78]KKQ16526.1 MAG: tRNA (guanine-N(1)-)-methyltransferase [Candidatus Moranbacteria bacterium GW2011_GWF2_36_839]HAT74171.1 tRNA (guanosine(37)-N1)-methyltransferase TrmD [Candidatus Moranbacteria bacterium]HBY11444.1 tRNA (guanosine(37)-N1)-methyltransferase TrmD [Candidatus Moranbacteria bacterium]
MKFDIITIFPQIFNSYFGESILARAQKNKIVKIKIHNLRDYATDKHQTVDDTPYGGGAGMLMKVEPIYKCLKSIKKSKKTRIILFSAKGKKYTQGDAKRLSKYDNLIFVCGRYEGVDERVAQNLVDEEISIGDYVLTGGEIPAMIVADSVSRLLPGVLGNSESARDESHSSEGYLEYPQYTKPEVFSVSKKKLKVPSILLSGNHKKIKEWRKEQSVCLIGRQEIK